MVSRLQWPSVFYVFGFIGIFWFLAWEKNASSSPAVDNKISKEERDYITSQTIKQVGKTIIPGPSVRDFTLVNHTVKLSAVVYGIHGVQRMDSI